MTREDRDMPPDHAYHRIATFWSNCKTVYVFTTTSTRSDARKYAIGPKNGHSRISCAVKKPYTRETYKEMQMQHQDFENISDCSQLFENFVHYIHTKRSKQHIVVGLRTAPIRTHVSFNICIISSGSMIVPVCAV